MGPNNYGGSATAYPTCVYQTTGVLCNMGGTDKCKKCGWNPVVAAERRAKFKEKRNAQHI